MSIKVAYIFVLFVFYVSILLGTNSPKVALLMHGYGTGLAFQKYDVAHDYKMIGEYYDAYKNSARTITLITRTAMVIWIFTLIFSIYIVSKKTFALPCKFEIVTLVVATIVIVLFVLLPLLLFGFNGRSPSPL